eukprot:1532994-Amphidinium_carterae.1
MVPRSGCAHKVELPGGCTFNLRRVQQDSSEKDSHCSDGKENFSNPRLGIVWFYFEKASLNSGVCNLVNGYWSKNGEASKIWYKGGNNTLQPRVAK